MAHVLLRLVLMHEIIGTSMAAHELRLVLPSLGKSRCGILLSGEHGVGKTHFAQAIHAASGADLKPAVTVHCDLESALLQETLLFGDPAAEEPGALEVAAGTTLVLKDPEKLSLRVQSRLTLHMDRRGALRQAPLRVISTSREDLVRWIEHGKMRLDLYYRLGVIALPIPPLRHRTRDIDDLSRVFLQRAQKRLGKNLNGFTPDALELLQTHSWPGNARELESVIERACILEKGPRLSATHLLLDTPVSCARSAA